MSEGENTSEMCQRSGGLMQTVRIDHRCDGCTKDDIQGSETERSMGIEMIHSPRIRER